MVYEVNLLIIPEPTARSAVRRGLLIPHGYLHPGKSKHSEVQFAVIKKMADVDFTTMLCEPELVMITAGTVLFAHINLGINNIYLTNFMVLMLCLFGYLFKI